MRLAVISDVLEELLSGQVMQPADDPRHPPVLEGHLADPARLPGEAELDLGASDLRVPVAQGGEPERLVRVCVLGVAHAQERRLEQPHNGCQHPLARESATRQVAGHPPPDARQGAGEVEQTVVLDLVAFAAPLGVIAVLLSAPRVAPGSLQMAAPVERDPDIAPRGRNGQALDPGGVAAVAEG